jgi:hypothetical protein
MRQEFAKISRPGEFKIEPLSVAISVKILIVRLLSIMNIFYMMPCVQ